MFVNDEIILEKILFYIVSKRTTFFSEICTYISDISVNPKIEKYNEI